jgi:hypothetical protein
MSRRRSTGAAKRSIRAVCSCNGRYSPVEIASFADNRQAPTDAAIRHMSERINKPLTGRGIDLDQIPSEGKRRAIHSRGTSRRRIGERWFTVARSPVFDPSPSGGRRATLPCPRC